MQYKVFGNDKYFISSERKLFYPNGRECELTVRNNKIRIHIHNKQVTVCLDWLWYTSYLECKLTPEQYGDINNIYYRPKVRVNLMHDLEVEMCFRRPIYYKEGYRVIPNFTDYAISRRAGIISTNDGKVYLQEGGSTRNSNGYPTVNLPGVIRTLQIHRLIALAWIPNNEPQRWQVNHKDGNKSNFKISNLEWVTPSENNLHACRTGLRDDVIPVKVLDIETWKVKTYPSMSDLQRELGFAPSTIKTHIERIIRSGLLGDRYEVKYLDDDSDWFYKEGEEVTVGRAVCRVTVTKPCGESVTYSDFYKFKQDYGVWNCPNVDRHMERARELHPEHKFEYERLYGTREVQCLNIETGEIITSESTRDLAPLVGYSRSSIRSLILRGELSCRDGFAFRYSREGPWQEGEFEEVVPRGRRICARNVKTGEVLEFKSLRATAKYFKFDRCVVNLRINTDLQYGDWLFEDKK